MLRDEYFKVPAFIANQPRPVKPDNINPLAWEYYWQDLACWRAMKADCLNDQSIYAAALRKCAQALTQEVIYIYRGSPEWDELILSYHYSLRND